MDEIFERDFDLESLKIGEIVPDIEFEVYQDEKIKTMSLGSLRKGKNKKWTILFFYPADFTFVCPTELEEMADLYKDFQKEGAEVISVSTDTVFVHKAWHDQSPAIGKIKFPMAADPQHNLSHMFGVHLHDEGVSLRGSFIIDPEGELKVIEMNHNDIGRSGKELLRKLRAAKFVKEHNGQVCPASWEKGDKTLKPGLDLVGKI